MRRTIEIDETDAGQIVDFLHEQARKAPMERVGFKDLLRRTADAIASKAPPEEFEWDVEVMRSIAPRRTYRVMAADEEIASQKALEMAANDDWAGAMYGDPDYEVDGVRALAPRGDTFPSWTDDRVREWVPRFMGKAIAEGYDQSTYRIDAGVLFLDIQAVGKSRVLTAGALAEAIRPSVAILEEMAPALSGWAYCYAIPVDTPLHQGSLRIQVTATTR